MEYAVEMTRFDERQTLDHLAEAGCTRSRSRRPPSRTRSRPRMRRRRRPQQNPGSIRFRRSLPTIARHSVPRPAFLAAEIDRLDQASRAAFAAVRALLERRGEQGFVRRCHGDLHLANIVLIEGKPVLFDAIEFDPLIASVDVLYDLAFPMMDFLHYGRRAAANGLLNRYLGTTFRRPSRRARGTAAVHVAARRDPRKGACWRGLAGRLTPRPLPCKSGAPLFRARPAPDPSSPPDAGRGRRIVRDRKIRAGARARA